ncbi:Zinc finger protein 706 [Plakobranchus ocellatus]|uniref:Zinc finger protein 706 n=1 Tax=Plakobranchus ocellatus TaxID=259542 RepID=A0AAV4AV43_9GAST|nr:Zinc finger protein 706 [Plakobranchus ocellatus]
MARGQQKIQSQQKNAAKKAAAQKGATSLADQKKAAAKALTHSCPVCKAQMPDPKTFKQHFENKHSKMPLPAELQDV